MKLKASSTFSSSADIIKHVDQATSQQIQTYQQRVEFINFAAMITKSDIVFAASKLSKFLTNSSDFHLECATRILKYLEYTKKFAIQFNSLSVYNFISILLISSDVSFADDFIIRYSSQEYAFKLFNNMID